MIVTGPSVARGGVSEALVNTTDLFVTIMEMAGIDPEEAIPGEVTHDSVSFFPVLSDPDAPTGREWLYADYFAGGLPGVADGDYAMRDERYKLLRFRGAEELSDHEEDPGEWANLATDPAYDETKAELAKWMPENDAEDALFFRLGRILSLTSVCPKIPIYLNGNVKG